MKKYIPFILGFVACLPVGAQKVDLQNKIILNRNKIEKSGLLPNFDPDRKKGTMLPHKNPGTRSDSEQSNSISGFVRIAEGYTAADLENIGMEVASVKGNIAIVVMPVDSVESFSNKECVAKLSLERKLNATMDLARAASKVDDIHSGEQLKMPYTGKNVLGIVVDQGVDPNHVSFLNKEGKSRVKYLTFLDGSYAMTGYPSVKYYGDDIIYEDEKGNVLKYPEVSEFYTDTPDAYHGTHTLNIFGGGYKGNITHYKGGELTEEPNPYYGVAPEADLAVSCGDLSDACVAWGLAEMLSYADYRKETDGTPSVVSISLGSTTGPHDPDNLMNQYLEACGEESIVVISAGNEGDLKLALNKTFTEEENTINSMVYPYGFQYDPEAGEASSKNTFVRNGVVMIYSQDETPFTLKAVIMTGTPGNYRKRLTLDLTYEDGLYYASDGWVSYVGGVANSTLNRYFEGYLGGGAALDEDLGRYYAALDYYLITDPETGINEDGSEAVIIGFEVTGEAGQRIDCYCDGANTYISNYGLTGYDDGSRNGTISDMAVGRNLLVVGAYTTRENWTALDGRDYSYENNEIKMGEAGPYSSYGELSDGRRLPHVCAPGTAIMSAVSNPWVDKYFKGYEDYIPYNTTAKTTVGDKTYYWKPETGTSMSTPLVAGGIALWLEADPTLTLKDVIDIIEKTSVKDNAVNSGDPVQWGAGKFDALAGLKEVIARTQAGVDQVSLDRNDRLILTKTGPGMYNIFVGSARDLKVEVYSVAGRCLYSRSFNGNEAELDLSSLGKGIYVVKVNNHTAKICL